MKKTALIVAMVAAFAATAATAPAQARGGFGLGAGVAVAAAAALAATGWRNSHAVAESSAGDNSALAIGAAGAIAVARSGGKCRISKLRNIHSLVRIARTLYAVGIAEAAGLNFLNWHRLVDRWHG